MRQAPQTPLDPRIKNVWRINDAVVILFNAAWIIGLLQLLRFDPVLQELAGVLTAVALGVAVLALVVWLVVLPPIRYMRWRYDLSEEYLDIARGILWRKRFVVPFIRVQNTDTRQGPIMRLFGLASVTVATAAGAHEIPGLDVQVADQLRDRAAELARLAREDV